MSNSNMLKGNQYEIIHCHSGEYQKYCRLRCDARYCGRRTNFSQELVASFHEVKEFHNLRRLRFLPLRCNHLRNYKALSFAELKSES